ncbi:site-2 protease family protein [Stieleria sp. ICT_E10.1]|uniref:site-2 protease family protein n=1 Tax=Stieleria sedimenti TaxID=2976331 RepID=UPI0021806912|nr:site-2 protease family protein [Stieleria sedimenti]MCS7471091.1 site-2 protease family protein [Stieleria sedimenti]
MFFKLSAPHVSIREYMYEGNVITMPIVLLIACVVKLLRIPIPGSTDIPAVASLQPFRVPAEKVDPEILKAITDLDLQVHELGFTRIDLIGINDRQNNTRYGGAAYRSSDGETVAWIRYRLWPNLERRNKFARLALYSLGPAGEIILTTAATRDLLDPPDWRVEYHPKVDANRLRDLHQQHVRRVLGNARSMIAGDTESAFDLLEHTHREFVEFQLDRGVFVRAPPNSVTPNVVSSNVADATLASPVEDDAVVAELVEQAERVEEFVDGDDVAVQTPAVDDTLPIIEAVRKQETKQSGWLSKLLILAVSIALFIGLGAWQWELELVLILVPILLVHELGHYVAMKAFGYKNIHMFFIPLLGAAVSGRHYRVSGWKKSIVALAGPLPSIALGLVLGGVGFWFENEWCAKGAVITLILNVLNLAPFLPLDGGQVAHVTLFSRSKVIDLLFRIGTIVILMLVAWLLDAKLMFGIGVAMALGLPTVWRTMTVTESIRRRDLPEPDNDRMPDEAIRAIVDEIQRANLPTQSTSTLAKLTLSVYENVIARPPSWPATLGIWALYFGGLFVGVVGMFAITLATVGGGMFDDFPEFETHYVSVETGDGQFRLGKPDADPKKTKLDVLAWRFSDADAATLAYDELVDTTDDSVARLGDFVFTSTVFTSTVVDSGEAEAFDDDFGDNFGDDFEAFAENDPRLDQLSGALWRRSFFGANPQLIVAVSADQAKDLIQATENLPFNIGDSVAISPWTPKIKATEAQLQLQAKLLVLQGKTEPLPWDPVQPPEQDNSADEDDPVDFRNLMRQSAERFEQIQRKRRDWIGEQAESSEGAARELYRAFLDFESESQAWRQDERPSEQKGPPPTLPDYLNPLLPELGFLHPDHPLRATSVNVEAYQWTPDAEDASFAETFPLDDDGRSLVYLQLTPTRDAAAAYATVHAWLKNQGIETVVWSYETAVE